MSGKALFITGFVSIASLAVMTALLLVGAFDNVDTAIAGMVETIITPSVRVAFKKITVLGDWRGISVIAVSAAIVLILRGKLVEALSLGVAIPITSVAYSSMKVLTGRARPTLTDQITSLSFPSGHAAMSAVLYFSLFVFAYVYMQRGYLRTVLLSLFAVVTVAVGFSRIYLERHWTTDVVAGWLLGIGIAALALALFRSKSSRA